MLRSASLLLACLFLGAAVAGAQDEVMQRHPLTDLPPQGEVSTGYYFPDHPTKRFPAGEVVTVVLAIHNDGAEPFNITAVMGSLNSPQDFKLYVQNFTQQVYFQNLAPGDELSVEYKFMPDPLLSPREFTVALTLFYADTKGQYLSSTFFNSTVEIVETKKFIDTDLLFLYLTLAALAAVAGYFAHGYLKDIGFLKKRSKKAKRTDSTNVKLVNDDEDYIKGTPYDSFRKRKAAQTLKAGTVASTVPGVVLK